jgi:hypothetical protein
MKKLISAVAILLLVSACQSSRSSHRGYWGKNTTYSVDRSGALWVEVPSSTQTSYPYRSSRTVSRTSSVPWSDAADWIDVSSVSSWTSSPYRSSWNSSYPYSSSRTVSRTTVPWSIDTNWIEIPSSARSSSYSYRPSGYNPASWRTWNQVYPTTYRSTSTYQPTYQPTSYRSTLPIVPQVPTKVSSPVYIGPVYGTVNVYP